MQNKALQDLASHFRWRAEQERARAEHAGTARCRQLHLELAAIFEGRAAGDPR